MNKSQLEINEILFYHVEKRNLKNVQKLLNEGANPTKICQRKPRSAIGESVFRNYPDVLLMLLKSCEEEYISYSGSSPKRQITSDLEIDQTPDEVEYPGTRIVGPGVSTLKINIPDYRICPFNSWPPFPPPEYAHLEALTTGEKIPCVSNFAAEYEWSRLHKYYGRIFKQTGEILDNTVNLKEPHCLDGFGQAPIHYAALLNHIECLNILLENGSPVDICTKNGVTPLHLAIKNPEIVEILLQYKADPNRKIYNTGESALHAAAEMGNLRSVDILLNAGTDINATNIRGQTPLMIAIYSRHTDVSLFLIDKNSKIYLQDDKGFSALYYSATLNNTNLTKYLLEKGARPFVRHCHYLLHICVRKNFLEIVKLLVEAGENVNIRNSSGESPLEYALGECNPEVIDFLLKNNADSKGQEFHWVIQRSHTFEQFEKVARVLLAHGISIDDSNCWGETPIMKSITMKRYRICDFLIKEGVDVNKGSIASVVDNLILARSPSDLKLLKLLVAAGYVFHKKPRFLKPPPWNSIDTSLEDWLAFNCHNPQSLQSLTRIRIRNQLMKQIKFVKISNYNQSKMLKLIKKLGLPKFFEKYLYDFNDLPKVLDWPKCSMFSNLNSNSVII